MSSACSGRYRISTGYVRPDTSMISAPPNASENRSGSMVAEVMMTFRSGRFGSSCRR